MKVAHLCATDSKGAGTAASRIHQAQWKYGIDSTMLLLRSWHPSVNQRLFNASPDMILTPQKGRPWEHAGIYISEKQWMEIRQAYPDSQSELELFSTPESVTNPDSCAVLKQSNIIQFHWMPSVINFYDLPEFVKNKQIVWRFSDLNPFTGGCHYARGCDKYEQKCGLCPQLGSNIQQDISRIQWLKKASAYRELDITCVAPSRWIANLCEKSSLLGDRRIEVIPNCVPLDIFKPQPAGSIRKQLGINPSHKVLLFAAASLTNPRKGFKHILEALINLAQAGITNFSLLSFGSVPEGISVNLPFPWHILPSLDKDEEIASAFSAADAFLFTPEEENFPSVVLESLAVGTPVIGFATGGTPEIVEDGVSGLLCPTGDDLSFVSNIKRFLQLPGDEINALKVQSRRRAEYFSEERCAEKYIGLYEQLLRKNRSGNIKENAAEESDIQIVCYEDTKSWILGKFAEELHKSLEKEGISSQIISQPNKYALISHHIPSLGWHAEDHALVRTLMITHVDTQEKLNLLKRQLALADMGICMSRDTRDKLVTSGIPAERLCFIHPAHDGSVETRKIRLAITSRLYPDARKRENMLLEVMEHLPASIFSFTIMGSGWEDQANALRSLGCDVTYYPLFDKNTYNSLFAQIDYYLYLGMDEGSMGFLDAMAAGVPSIVTAQGYHLEAASETNYFFKTSQELIKILSDLAAQKSLMRDSVAQWTWANYTKSHLLLWNYLLQKRSGEFNKKFLDALRTPKLPAPRARALVASGRAPNEAWLAAAEALLDKDLAQEGLYALRHYLINNPEDLEQYKKYEKWNSAMGNTNPLRILAQNQSGK